MHDKSNHMKCDECPYTTFQPYMLKKHKLRQHDKSIKYSCDASGCTFFSYALNELKSHIRGVHEKIKPHKCSECTCCYSTKYRLSVHMLREHGIVYN